MLKQMFLTITKKYFFTCKLTLVINVVTFISMKIQHFKLVIQKIHFHFVFDFYVVLIIYILLIELL